MDTTMERVTMLGWDGEFRTLSESTQQDYEFQVKLTEAIEASTRAGQANAQLVIWLLRQHGARTLADLPGALTMGIGRLLLSQAAASDEAMKLDKLLGVDPERQEGE